jgi:hypothetical protein
LKTVKTKYSTVEPTESSSEPEVIRGSRRSAIRRRGETYIREPEQNRQLREKL